MKQMKLFDVMMDRLTLSIDLTDSDGKPDWQLRRTRRSSRSREPPAVVSAAAAPSESGTQGPRRGSAGGYPRRRQIRLSPSQAETGGSTFIGIGM